MQLMKCLTCGLDKASSDFYKYHRSKCKACCCAEASKRGSDKEKRRRRHIDRWKKSKGCCYCGYNDSAVALDLHHENESKKYKGVSTMLTQKLRLIMDEIRKCVVVCANCHRRLHNGEL